MYNQALKLSTILMLVGSVLLLIMNFNKGFDITDESYYLLISAHPKDQLFGLTYFGYYTNIIFQLVGENIVLFRLSGFLLLLFSSYWMAQGLCQFLEDKHQFIIDRNIKNFTVFIITASVITYHIQWWLTTPSYNWLTLLGLIIIANALLHNSSLLIKAFLLGLGGFICFMGKPSSALLAGFLSSIWIICYDKKKWSLIAFAALIFFFLFTVHVYMYFQSYSAFIQNIFISQDLMQTLVKNSMTVYSLFHQTYEQIGHVLIAAIAAIFILLSANYYFKPYKKQWNKVLFVLTIIGWILLLLWNAMQPSILFGSILLLSFMNLLFIMSYKNVFPILGINIFSILITFTYAFGTYGDLITQMSGAVVFLVIAIISNYLMINKHQQEKHFFYIPCFLIALSISLIFWKSWHHPYRLVSPIATQQYAVQLWGTKGVIRVDKETKQYIHQVQNIALKNGWKERTSLLDLTGATPGISVILNAKFIGTAWLIGGFGQSNEYAKKVLNSVPSNLIKNSWILTTENESQKLDENILKKYHLSFPENYEKVGVFKTGYRQEEQVLWKPRYE